MLVTGSTVAVSCGQNFAVVKVEEVKNISLLSTKTAIWFEKTLFIIHKGEGFLDSVEIERLLKSKTTYPIIEYVVKQPKPTTKHKE